MPVLTEVFLYLHISKEQIGHAYSDLAAHGWVQACTTLAKDEEIQNLKIFLTEIREANLIYWKYFLSSKDPLVKLLNAKGGEWNPVLEESCESLRKVLGVSAGSEV